MAPPAATLSVTHSRYASSESERTTGDAPARPEPVPHDRSSESPVCDFTILDTYPHDPNAFTQGLVFDNGYLYESTGLNGQSSLRKVELQTGKVLKILSLPGKYFAEGLTEWHGNLLQLTWRSGVGLVYDKETFSLLHKFYYSSEGWGLTHDDTSLIKSDGSSILYFLDPETYAETKRIQVRDHGVAISSLNELEYVKGKIFANVWQRDVIAIINPDTGEVIGWLDLGSLRNALGPVSSIDVLNGIAYNPAHDSLLITGKLWPKLFEIQLTSRNSHKP